MHISELHFPDSAASLCALLQQDPPIAIVAGGTATCYRSQGHALAFPPVVASLSRIQELQALSRTEQTIAIGSCVRLSQLRSIPPFDHPAARAMLFSIGTEALRNAATLGGHLLYRDSYLTLWPLLESLDAFLEFRQANRTFSIRMDRLVQPEAGPLPPPQSLLLKARIPARPIDYLHAARIGGSPFPNGEGAWLVCSAYFDRTAIGAFRLVLAGRHVFRDMDLEQSVSGQKLPLSKRRIRELLDRYGDSLAQRRCWNTDRIMPAMERALGILTEGF
ncbi:MAG: FAD binding domain-containing protein [Rectinemataceae bacterium]|nr:FAD binding domain-containing protein [Spirochaetaceae bacterium]